MNDSALGASAWQQPMVTAKARNGRAAPMCDKCVELDKKAERYRSLEERLTDRTLISGIASLIERTENEKRALHPKAK